MNIVILAILVNLVILLILVNLIVLENLLLLVKLVILMMPVAGESGNFVEYGDLMIQMNILQKIFLDIRFRGHSNFHFFTNNISLKLLCRINVRFFFTVQKQ